jgi:hypothetical protein
MKTVVLLEFKSSVQSHKARAKALSVLMKFLGRRFRTFSLAIDWEFALWKLVIPKLVPLKHLSLALRHFVLMKPSHA